jgi:hypothetical protein
MTLEQKYDRWERIARLIYDEATRSARASRKRTKELKSYVDALRQYDAAKTASEELPEDLDTKESLVEAKQILDRAREALRR